jgi:hypothetical protein
MQVHEDDKAVVFFIHGSIELHSSPTQTTPALHLDEP